MKYSYSHIFVATVYIGGASLILAVPINLQDVTTTTCATTSTTQCSPAPQTPYNHLDPSSLFTGKVNEPALTTRSMGNLSLSNIQILNPRSTPDEGSWPSGRQIFPSTSQAQPQRQTQPQNRRSRRETTMTLNMPYDIYTIPMAPNGIRMPPRPPFSNNATPVSGSPEPEPEPTSPPRYHNGIPLQRTPSPEQPPMEREPIVVRAMYQQHIHENDGINLTTFRGPAEHVRILSTFPDGLVHDPIINNGDFLFQGKWHRLPPGGFRRVAYGANPVRPPSPDIPPAQRQRGAFMIHSENILR